MPLILSERHPVLGQTFIWSLTEDQSFFEAELSTAHLYVDHIIDWHSKRQQEWLAGRFLIHKYLSSDLSQLKTNEHGRPVLLNSKSHFSISHTAGLVGLQISDRLGGLDLQIQTDKIARVAHKYCTAQDYALMETHVDRDMAQHMIWGIKECIFKAYPSNGLSYKNDIIIKSLSRKSMSLSFVAVANKDGHKAYHGDVRVMGSYVISRAVESTHIISN